MLNTLKVKSNESEEGKNCIALILRMYLNWAAAKDHQYWLDWSDDSIKIECQNLESEAKIHRICRISPFDPQNRRHTTFVTVEVNSQPPAPTDNGTKGIRSYVFAPYKRVKDMDTGIETEDIEGVIKGNLDKFLV